jgi:hypothetical protein
MKSVGVCYWPAAQNGQDSGFQPCLVLGVKPKISARSEYFAF